MNQKQRDFLISRVNKMYDSERRLLEESKRDKPNLNNYIVTAFLDGTIKVQDLEALKAKMRQAVLDDGIDDLIIEDDQGWNSYRSRSHSKKRDKFAKIPIELLFVMPPEYLEALEKWKAETVELAKRMSELEAIQNTVTMKIQIGSDKVLDKLISEADNIGELKLMNASLTLDTTKQLGE